MSTHSRLGTRSSVVQVKGWPGQAAAVGLVVALVLAGCSSPRAGNAPTSMTPEPSIGSPSETGKQSPSKSLLRIARNSGVVSRDPMALLSSGARHCRTGRTLYLEVHLPDQPRTLYFVRSPTGDLGPDVPGRLALDATLPDAASSTGVRIGQWDLLIDSSPDAAAAYLVGATTTERWPSVPNVGRCE